MGLNSVVDEFSIYWHKDKNTGAGKKRGNINTTVRTYKDSTLRPLTPYLLSTVSDTPIQPRPPLSQIFYLGLKKHLYILLAEKVATK